MLQQKSLYKLLAQYELIQTLASSDADAMAVPDLDSHRGQFRDTERDYLLVQLSLPNEPCLTFLPNAVLVEHHLTVCACVDKYREDSELHYTATVAIGAQNYRLRVFLRPNFTALDQID